MRLAIVHPQPHTLSLLGRLIIQRTPWQLLWSARTGNDAIARCAQAQPDLLLLDPTLRQPSAAETIRQIMERTPCAILLVTSGIARNAALVFESLGAGALDAIDLAPPVNEASIEQLQRKIGRLSGLIVRNGSGSPVGQQFAPDAKARSRGAQQPLLAIGASTGGPAVLRELLAKLAPDPALAVVIVQHLDARFAPGLAAWLNNTGRWPVQIIRDAQRPEPGLALLAQTNDHLHLTTDGRLRYSAEPREAPYRPSVDVFFDSLALHWPGTVVGVLLTGMGRDGAAGLKALRALGHHTIVQDEASCAVYGMPKAAMAMQAACRQLTPAEIPTAVADALTKSAESWRRP